MFGFKPQYKVCNVGEVDKDTTLIKIKYNCNNNMTTYGIIVKIKKKSLKREKEKKGIMIK